MKINGQSPVPEKTTSPGAADALQQAALGASSSIYLDDAQRIALATARAGWMWRTEWPTWLLIATIYGSWFGIATHARQLGLPIAVPALALTSAWYMSLQHELLHGHPTRWRWLNAALGCAPLAVWFPYGLYRASHLAHHAADLADPRADPESYFVTARRWSSAGRIQRALLIVRTTFVGRLLIGPAFALADASAQVARRLHDRDYRDIPMWLAHLTALGLLASWLEHVAGIAPWLLLAGIGYPALSLSAIRSFHEHRAHADPTRRTVINQAAWPWRLLFLNNNFHAVHHDLPQVPWFALPQVYRRHATEYQRRSGGFVVRGYAEWMLRFAVRPVASVVHPNAVKEVEPGAARVGRAMQLSSLRISGTETPS